MKFFSIQMIAVFVVALSLGGALLYTSQNVQNALHDLALIDTKIETEKERLRVLRAEWAFLNSPQRLEQLAKEYYGVSAPTVSQMAGGTQDFPFPTPVENISGGGFEEASYIEETEAAMTTSEISPASGEVTQ